MHFFFNYFPQNKYDRLWEPLKEDLVDSPQLDSEDVLPKRETLKKLKLDLEEKKKEQSYIVVPHMLDPSAGDRPFWIRLFASDPIDVALLPETLKAEERGAWSKDLKQGPRLIDGSVENSHWCENPQYFLNLHRPTHVKIVLQRLTGFKKKNLGANIGLLLAKSETDKNAQFTMDKAKKIEKRKKQMEAMREALKTKSSISLSCVGRQRCRRSRLCR
jgi:hypothetical protein